MCVFTCIRCVVHTWLKEIFRFNCFVNEGERVELFFGPVGQIKCKQTKANRVKEPQREKEGDRVRESESERALLIICIQYTSYANFQGSRTKKLSLIHNQQHCVIIIIMVLNTLDMSMQSLTDKRITACLLLIILEFFFDGKFDYLAHKIFKPANSYEYNCSFARTDTSYIV